MTFDAGSIDARLTLDRSAFSRELAEARAQAERFENTEIVIPVNLRSSEGEFLRLQEEINNLDDRTIDLYVEAHGVGEIENLRAQIASLTGKTVDVDVNPQTEDLARFEERIEGIRNRDVDINVQVFASSLARLEERIRALSGRTLSVDVLTDNADLIALQAEIAALNDQTVTINVRFTNSRAEFTRMLNQIAELNETPIIIGTRFENSRAEFTRIRNQIDQLSGSVVDVSVEVDDAQLAVLASEIEATSGASVSVDVDTGDSQPELAALNAEIDALAGRHINLEIDFASGEALSQLELFHAEAETVMRPIVLGVDVDKAHLEALHEDLNRMVAAKYSLNVDADTSAALAELAALESQTDALLNRDHQLTIDFDVNQATALGQLALFDAAVEGVTGNATVNVDVDGVAAAMAQLEVLEAAVKRVDGQDINIDVDMDRGAAARTTGSVTRMEAIIAGILLLAPLIPAVVAPGAAAVGGLAAGITAAAGGVGVLALGVGSAATEFGKAKKEINDANDKLAELTPGTKKYAEQARIVNDLQKNFNETWGTAADAFEGMSTAWGSFQDATRPASIGLMTQLFGLVEDILPRLVPIFDAFGGVASEALGKIGAFINGPEGERMFTFFEEIGAQSFDEILQSLGNLTLFFGRLFEAFGPFAVEMLDGLSDITAGWAEWADGIGETQGFQDFLDYARTVGPQVLDMLGSLFDAFIAIGEALAPLAGPALTAFTFLFDAIANAPTGLLTTLIVLFGGLFLAVQGLTFIGQAYRATVAAMGVATAIFNGIMTVLRGVLLAARIAMFALNVAFAANPIGVIIVAILALIAVFVLAYNKIGWFRDAVNAVVDAIVGAFQWLYDQLWGHSILKDLINAFTTAFKFIKDAIMTPIKFVIGWVKTIFNALKDYFTTVLGIYKSIIRGGWNAIKAVWRAAIDAIKAALKLVFDTIPRYIREKFDAVMDIVRGLKDRITGFFTNAAGWLKDAGWNIIKGLVTGIKDAAGDILQGTLDWVTDKIPDWKGPPEKDKRILRPAGGYLIGGLVEGILGQVPSLESTLGSITNKIEATSAGISATLTADGRMAPGAAAGGANMTVNVISPSRLRVDEGLTVGLKRATVAAGYST